MGRLKTFLIIVSFAALSFSGALPAKAGLLHTDFDLNLPNIGGFQGPYVRVSIDLASVNTNVAIVTFTSLSNGGNIYDMIGNGFVALNVNAATFLKGSPTLTAVGSPFGSPVFSSWTSGFGGPFGSFNLLGGISNLTKQANFQLTNTTSAWSNADQVLTPNTAGYSAEAQVMACLPICSFSEANIFNVTNSPIQTVNTPEPTTFLILTSGLFLLSYMRRKTRRCS